MFTNSLTGLSKREKEVFDQVCIHLNGCMRRMGLKHLDGEEDQILMDLWMDTFPYKTDADGNFVYRTVHEKVVEIEPICEKKLKKVEGKDGVVTEQLVDVVVGGRKVERVVEKQVRELDYSHSLVESTSVGIYKWRGEQLLLNKCKYLFGDTRTRKMVEGKAATEVVVDAWGNARVRAVYEEELDPKKVAKRDFTKKVNESDLARDGEDPITIADVAGTTEGGYEEALLMYDLSRVCDELEMRVVRKFMDGDSANRIYADFEVEGVKFSARQMSKLKDKLRGVLRPLVTT